MFAGNALGPSQKLFAFTEATLVSSYQRTFSYILYSTSTMAQKSTYLAPIDGQSRRNRLANTRTPAGDEGNGAFLRVQVVDLERGCGVDG